MKTRLLISLVAALLGGLFILQQVRTPDTEVSQPVEVDQDPSLRAYARDAELGADLVPPEELSANLEQTKANPNHLVFLDGDIVEINWRKYPMPSVRNIDIDNYEVLREAAMNGDAVISMILHEWQNGCRLQYETDEELEVAVDQLYQTHTYPVPGRDQSTALVDPKEVDLIAEGLRSNYLRCRKFAKKQGNLDEKWLERAAADGSSAAMIEMGLRQTDPELAESLYRKAWNAGNPGGLLELATMRYQSYESGDDPTANIEAFAIFHTYIVIEQVMLKKYGESGRKFAQTMRNELDKKQSLLLPRELEAALDMSRQMIRLNPNCCFSH